jgi:hypothetical protein
MREANSKIIVRKINPTLIGIGEGLRRSAEGLEAIATQSFETKPSQSRKRVGKVKEKSIAREFIRLVVDPLILDALNGNRSEESPRRYTEINLSMCFSVRV